MADVIRRSGTGIERGIRWKSGNAPGTRDVVEASQLSGNSANAELAAKQRVNAVCRSLPLPPSVASDSNQTYRLLRCGQGFLIMNPSTFRGIWLMDLLATTIVRLLPGSH